MSGDIEQPHQEAERGSGPDIDGTQHLSALAAPGALADWRLALCFETAHDAGVLDGLPATAPQIAAARRLDEAAVRAILYVLVAWEYATVDDNGVFSVGPRGTGQQERAALAQHGAWIRRWATLVPRRVHDRQAAAPDEPPRPDPAVGLALLESASRPYHGPVTQACRSAYADGVAAPANMRVLDLGGGHGAYALEFARHGCVTTMQDLPGVIDLARTDGRLASAGVELVAGDAFVELPAGPFDLVLCGTLTNIFDMARVRDLLGRLRGILASDGQLAIATWVRDRGPVGAAFGVQMLVATPGGDAHSEDDYRAALGDAGYSDIRVTEHGDPPLALILARCGEVLHARS
ncbi:class I SAM-dependent methyltransferase [Micromonospora craniellae]|nr:class I SAM-dependent methyltransferase [Micromonospora craniellae]QOC91033.1 methyltransferase domain-containing protein [Micromonospora craniellae]